MVLILLAHRDLYTAPDAVCMYVLAHSLQWHIKQMSENHVTKLKCKGRTFISVLKISL